MKMKITTWMRFVSIPVLMLSIVLSACSSLVQRDTQAETATEATAYQEFTLPFPEEVSFELPEGWDFWGNAGYLSADNGKTYAGVRMAWIEAGRNAEEALYNEGSIVHEKTTVKVGDLETHRYIVEVTLTSASTGEIIMHSYEMIYAFPAPNGEMVAGVTFSAPTQADLERLIPVAEHMVESLKWGTAD